MRFCRFLFLCLGFVFLSHLNGYEASLLADYSFDGRLGTIKKYAQSKRVFIETGTGGGGGVLMALLSGFQEVYSVELFSSAYEEAVRKIGHEPGVHLHLGDSAEYLSTLLPTIQEPVVFWLDAHYSGEGTWKYEYEKVPIIRELRAIAEHPIKTHTILIDDVRCFGTNDFDGILLEEVIANLKLINPNYKIVRENGWIENDVLVATVLE